MEGAIDSLAYKTVVAAGPNPFPTIKMRAHKKRLVLVASLLFQSDAPDAVRIINAAYNYFLKRNSNHAFNTKSSKSILAFTAHHAENGNI